MLLPLTDDPAFAKNPTPPRPHLPVKGSSSNPRLSLHPHQSLLPPFVQKNIVTTAFLPVTLLLMSTPPPPPPPDPPKPPPAKTTGDVITRYIVAVLAAWAAEAATYPFDLCKTRLMLQSEAASTKEGLKIENKGMISTAVGIARKEGILKLWSGMIPMCQRHVIYAGFRLVAYERMRDVVKDEKGQMSLGASIVCGATAGMIAQFFASPADLVKVQMQAEGRRRLQGKPPRFKNCTEVYQVLYRQSGFLGYWRGAVPNMYRAAFICTGDLAAYDIAKKFMINELKMEDNAITHTGAAAAAGLTAAVLGTPADFIKTRLMNQPVGPDGKGLLYSGIMDCIRKSIKHEGLLSIYKGFVPLWIRLGPWALVNWVAFENIMLLIGGQTFAK